MAGVDVASVTVGFPVSDLRRAVQWYRRVLELGEPDLEPAEGVVEFQLGPVWLQLGEEPAERSGAQVVTRFEVSDVRGERDRLVGLGVAVGPLQHVEGAVDYCDFADPDGNMLSFYTELS